MKFVRALVTSAVLLAIWEAAVRVFALPHYILPAPSRVAATLFEQRTFLAQHALITLGETVAGFIAGSALGIAIALAVAQFAVVRRWVLPVVLVSQAIPIFAIAPLLVIWFGFGIESKIIAAALVIFFPIASAFADGLMRTDRGFVDLARVMGADRARMLLRVRVPAALPHLASGLRVAAVFAPLGAVVGEWVGAAGGLGFIMLQSNARMQTDAMFAALSVLATMTVVLYHLVDRALRRIVFWQPTT